MIYLIAFISFLFILLNLKFSNNDWFDPSVIFSLIFFVQSIFCILALSYLKLQFHSEVLMILLISFSLFFIVSLLSKSRSNSRRFSKLSGRNTVADLKPMSMSVIITMAIIFSFIVLTFVRYKLLGDVAAAYGKGGLSLSEKIALYDNLTKFHIETYNRLGVSLPRYYGLLNAVAYASGYLIIYESVHNYILTKKIKTLNLVTILLMLIFMYFGGSRSTIFRVITFVGVIYYVLYMKDNIDLKRYRKLIAKIFLYSILIVMLFMASISLYGRTNNFNPFHYLFIYVGAPLYNLDFFIQHNNLPIQSNLFGKQTFYSWYSYLGAETSNMHYIYSLDLPFLKYSSEYSLGNVYTTFYQFLYDFSYIGIVPLMIVIATYYVFSYDKLKRMPSTSDFKFSLFLYAFLFNDLIMLFFSNRFYETILSIGNIRMLVIAFLLGNFIYNGYIKIINFKFYFR